MATLILEVLAATSRSALTLEVPVATWVWPVLASMDLEATSVARATYAKMVSEAASLPAQRLEVQDPTLLRTALAFLVLEVTSVKAASELMLLEADSVSDRTV